MAHKSYVERVETEYKKAVAALEVSTKANTELAKANAQANAALELRVEKMERRMNALLRGGVRE